MADVEYLISLRDKMSGSLKSIESQMKSLDSAIAKGGHSVDQLEKKSNKASHAMIGLASAVAGIGLGRFANGALKASIELEKTKISFETMLGSAEKGGKMVKDITDFALKTPFSVAGVMDSTKMLMAMGIETEKLIPTLKALGDVSSGTGAPLSRLALNLGQVKSVNKLERMDFKEFAKAGVPLEEYLSETMKVSRARIQAMITEGSIDFSKVEKAFIAMTSEGGKYFNLMGRLNDETLYGQMAQAAESFETLMISVGNSIGDFINPFVQVVNRVLPFLLKNGKAIENIASVALPFASAAVITLGYASLKASGLLAGMGGALKAAAIAALPLTIALKGLQILVEEVNRFFSDGSKKIVTTMDIAAANFNIGFGKVLLATINFFEDLYNKIPGSFLEIMNGIGDSINGWFESLFKSFAGVVAGTADVIAKANNYILKSVGLGGDSPKKQIDVIEPVAKKLEKSSFFEDARGFIENRIKSSQSLLKSNSLIGKEGVLKNEDLSGGSGGDEMNGISVTSAAPKTFNINIEKLVDQFKIETTNIKEAPEKIEKMITDAITRALADVQVR